MGVQSFGAGVLISAVLLVSSQPASAQFVQQGPKLVGTGVVGSAEQGFSVALSADGNTAIVGGLNDNSQAGAAWVYTRSNGVWTQQGGKLVGTGAVGNAAQGASVTLSADGNTAVVGGPFDNSFAGAAWVFTRSAGIWSQQGGKLIGTGAVGNARQGVSVALSADGTTLVAGGSTDNSQVGATWVFTRSGNVWTQEAKLVGTGVVVSAQQGIAVALSDDGNTALVGGRTDNSNAGAAWVFTRSGSVWTQQGGKLVGTGAVGNAFQGAYVSLSADGNTAAVGGPFDNMEIGAGWIYTRSGGVWTQQAKLVGTGAIGQSFQGTIALSGSGNMAIMGGALDDTNIGATWVFTRSGGVWTQQGGKLIGTGAVGGADQGIVALSTDANTALVGGILDNGSVGAVWVFVQPPVTFSTFTNKLTISSFKPGFTLLSKFALGSGSNGINPIFDTVTLRIGSFTTTIPPFSFTMTGPGTYSFNGLIDSVLLKVSITQSGSTYTFQATANANLSKLKNPATVTLTIGNDTGTATVRF
jgi:hypothetical protein